MDNCQTPWLYFFLFYPWPLSYIYFLGDKHTYSKYKHTLCFQNELNWKCLNIKTVSLHSVSQSVQLLSRVQLFATPWIAALQASLSITNTRSLLKLMPIESVMPYSHLILCHPLLLLPPIPLSIRVFSNESPLLMRWRKYWSFSFSISPPNEHPGLISFRMDWLDLLEVQRALTALNVNSELFF